MRQLTKYQPLLTTAELVDIYCDFYEEIFGFRPAWLTSQMDIYEIKRMLDHLADIRLSFDSDPLAKETASIAEFERLITYLSNIKDIDRRTTIQSLGTDLRIVEVKFNLPNGYLSFFG
jgi:hypothetical protein